MALPTYTSALIVGAGPGLSASLTRLLRQEGLAVAIAARDTAKLALVVHRNRCPRVPLRRPERGASAAIVR